MASNERAMASAAARERFARKNEQEDLKNAFVTIDKKRDDKIDPEGVFPQLPVTSALHSLWQY